jgi:phospholipid transport system substrate-binding protein
MAFDGVRWRAYDVSVEGVSLLTNYRSSFVRLARQKGIDGLIQDLAQRNATRSAGSAAGG